MKPGRQSVILEIITQKNIETQNQLLEELKKRGIKSTQATLSRDIKDMRLVKEPGENGKTRYVKPAEREEHNHHSRLQKILRESIQSVDIAQNIIVIKTLPALASGACSAIDSMEVDGLVGTLAGDDTAFIAMKTNRLAEKFLEELNAGLDNEN